MDQYRQFGWDPTAMEVELSSSEQPDAPSSGAPDNQSAVSRQFEFRPIIGPNRQGFGIEMIFRAGWDDPKTAANASSRIMLDNCLLYGFDELAPGRSLFLTCTRETLLSSFLSLLPRSVVYQIPESVEADHEVIQACRRLKREGHCFALDDFESLDAMDGFLEIVDFIKIDYQHAVRRTRACMLRRLRLTHAALVGLNIESEQQFQRALDDGFELFQGPHCGENVACATTGDSLDPVNCLAILEALDWPDLSIDDLANLISEEPGIEQRILRKAKWIYPRAAGFTSLQDALRVVSKEDVHKIVNLAIEAASEQCVNQALVTDQPRRDTRGDDALIRWFEMGAKAPWWWIDDNKDPETH